MTCHTVGFSTIQRNEVRDITATLLTEVCHNVATESPLQPLSREVLTIVRPTEKMVLTSTSEWEVFWNRAQDAFLNVRYFIPTQLVIIPWASRQPSTTMSNPLVISTSGRLGPTFAWGPAKLHQQLLVIFLSLVWVLIRACIGPSSNIFQGFSLTQVSIATETHGITDNTRYRKRLSCFIVTFLTSPLNTAVPRNSP